MANLVKESGSNSGRQRLLLETEKSAFFHKSNVIAATFILKGIGTYTTSSGPRLFRESPSFLSSK